MSGRKGQEERAETSALMQSAFDTVTQGIVIYNNALQLERWNPSFAAMKISEQAALFPGAELQCLYLEFARAGVFGLGDHQQLAQQQVAEIYQYGDVWTGLMNIPSTGRTVRIKRFLLPDKSLCITFDDVTDEIRIEAQLRQTQKMNALGKLTGGVAHDINNMLAIVTGSLELALDRVSDDETKQLINTALDASDRGAGLTQRLLSFARKQTLKPESIEPEALLSGLLDMLRKMLSENIVINLQVNCTGWHCEVDPNQLETAIVNLVVNARDAMPDGGQIDIEACYAHFDSDAAKAAELPVGDYIHILVKDNGQGIDPMALERVFEPFFTTKDVGQGTGLGLSMVQGFVKQSGGCIRLVSEVGQGTTARIYLPAVRSEVHVEREIPELSVAAGNRQRVLLVEDDPVLREVISVQLQILGFIVMVAETAQEALEMLCEEPSVSLMLTDVMLPGGMNGRQLSEQAGQIREGLAVVFMSGYSDDLLMENDRLDDNLILLQKPFKQAQLAGALNQALAEQGRTETQS